MMNDYRQIASNGIDTSADAKDTGAAYTGVANRSTTTNPTKITALYAGVIIGTKPTKPENIGVLPILSPIRIYPKQQKRVVEY